MINRVILQTYDAVGSIVEEKSQKKYFATLNIKTSGSKDNAFR